jgi:hypothetical protein
VNSKWVPWTCPVHEEYFYKCGAKCAAQRDEQYRAAMALERLWRDRRRGERVWGSPEHRLVHRTRQRGNAGRWKRAA